MAERFALWRRFGDGIPAYLARHYWWAYLWRPGVWFFDHQPVINAILFGQYRRLLETTLRHLGRRPPGRLLQLTCVYGLLSPSIVRNAGEHSLYLCDVAPVQLEVVRRKLNDDVHNTVHLARMDAERLAYRDGSFSTVLVFLLLHELPAAARLHVLEEIVRVIAPGGGSDHRRICAAAGASSLVSHLSVAVAVDAPGALSGGFLDGGPPGHDARQGQRMR